MRTDFWRAGAIRIRVTGEKAPLFPGALHSRGVVMQDIVYERNSCLLTIKVTDVSVVRRERRLLGVRAAIVNRTGLPFLMQRLTHWTPFAVTSLLFFLLLILLSCLIVRIDVTGVPAPLSNDITRALQKEGIRTGALRMPRSETETAERVKNHVTGVAWLTISRTGAVYTINAMPAKKETRPTKKKAQIKAAKTGVVTSLFVQYGKAVVRPGDVVLKGEPLIIGGREGALGTVTAETWYKARVTAASVQAYKKGAKQKRSITLHAFHKTWALFAPEPFKGRSFEEKKNYNLFFFSYQLPVSFTVSTSYQLSKTALKESKKEAEQKAIQSARAALLAKLPRGALIKGEKVLQTADESGKVNMTIHFQVLENIAND